MSNTDTPRIIFTGGGTAGHVIPNLAIIEELKNYNFNLDIHYIGTSNGIENKLITSARIPFHPISAGKLRRYLSWQNFTDIFKTLQGVFTSLKLLFKLKPRLVFSKGGYVSCPVVWAAALLRIPVIIHESDFSPGLANRLSFPFAQVICYTFPETINKLPKTRSVHTDLPVRRGFTDPDKNRGLNFLQFSTQKEVLLIVGGSLGSETINQLIRNNLKTLLKQYQICHIVGAGNIDQNIADDSYRQFEYIDNEMIDVIAAADLVISRAGATAIFELLASRTPHILIPLSIRVSRGDQILNARSFQNSGYSLVIEEDNLTEEILLKAISELQLNKQQYQQAMSNATNNSSQKIVELINKIISQQNQ